MRSSRFSGSAGRPLGSAARVAAKSPRSWGRPVSAVIIRWIALGGEPFGFQFGAYALQPDLIQFIQRDEDAAEASDAKPQRLGQPKENLAVVDAHGEAGEAQCSDSASAVALHQLDLSQSPTPRPKYRYRTG